MSYQVLARKWRPRSFSTLVGQEHVVRALTHALSEQRLHHAYLFTGTRGVGKTTIARILAKSLNCETGITAVPCGVCSACTEIDAGRFVDLLEVDAATNTRVDEMRQLLENAVYAPTRGRFKVYVIDEVHMLSNSAFNAMLKTLEEPPEHVKFILATTDPQKIPVTVLSRCLQFNLKQMPVGLIAHHLTQILQAEGFPFELPALSLIARSASGSMRDALSLLDQAIAHGGGRVDVDQVRSMLGTVDQDYLFKILDALLVAQPAELLDAANQLALRSLSFASALQDLAAMLTRIQVLQCVPATRDPEDADAGELARLAEAFSPEFVQLAYQIVNAGRAELGVAPDEYSGFVMTLLRLYTFRPMTVGEYVAQRTPVAKPAPLPVATHGVSAPVSKPARADAPLRVDAAPEVLSQVAEPSPVSADMAWNDIVAKLALTGLARELAQNCELRSLGNQECVLRLAPGNGHLQMKPSPERLQKALSDCLGRPLVLKIEVGEPELETPAERVGKQRQAEQQRAVAAIEEDGFVRDAMDMLGATVIESSIKPIV